MENNFKMSYICRYIKSRAFQIILVHIVVFFNLIYELSNFIVKF